MEEYVLRGNAAILKCHIPSFVSEYVTVISWIISEDNEEVEIKLDSASNVDGRSRFSAITLYLYWFHPYDCIKRGNIGRQSFILFPGSWQYPSTPWASRPTLSYDPPSLHDQFYK